MKKQLTILSILLISTQSFSMAPGTRSLRRAAAKTYRTFAAMLNIGKSISLQGKSEGSRFGKVEVERQHKTYYAAGHRIGSLSFEYSYIQQGLLLYTCEYGESLYTPWGYFYLEFPQGIDPNQKENKEFTDIKQHKIIKEKKLLLASKITSTFYQRLVHPNHDYFAGLSGNARMLRILTANNRPLPRLKLLSPTYRYNFVEPLAQPSAKDSKAFIEQENEWLEKYNKESNNQ